MKKTYLEREKKWNAIPINSLKSLELSLKQRSMPTILPAIGGSKKESTSNKQLLLDE
jgi:hypothetical protein